MNVELPARADPDQLLRIALLSDGVSPLDADGADPDPQADCVAGLACELARAGHLVDVFTRRGAIGRKQLVCWHDRLRIVNVPVGPAHALPKEGTLPYGPAFARFVTRFARHGPAAYELVHAHYFTSGAIARHLGQTLGTPFVVSFHTLGLPQGPSQELADAVAPARVRIERQLMAQAGRLLAASPQEQQDMVRLYGAEPARIAVVPGGFDPEASYPGPQGIARVRLGLAPRRFTVLQAGRIAPREGVDTAIQAAAVLHGRHGINAQLLVVGGEAVSDAAAGARCTGVHQGPETTRLRELAERLDIDRHVHFLGPRRHAALRDCYCAADAVVCTPWHAPSGAAPVEAMACARPVVGAEVGAIKSTVVDGETGFLVPSRDPQATADRLALLHARPDLARRMGEAGLRRARRDFTWRAAARQVAAVYADVTAEASGRLPIDLTQP